MATRSFKYQPLLNYLVQFPRVPEVSLTLDQIEEVLGFVLPASARLSSWWANDPENGHYQATAWVKAGFRCRKAGNRVCFVRNTLGQGF